MVDLVFTHIEPSVLTHSKRIIQFCDNATAVALVGTCKRILKEQTDSFLWIPRWRKNIAETMLNKTDDELVDACNTAAQSKTRS